MYTSLPLVLLFYKKLPYLPTCCLYRISFLVVCLCGIFDQATAQVVPSFSCGTDLLHQTQVETDTVYQRFVLKTRQQLLEKTTDKSFDGITYTIPVVFVVYNLGEAVGSGSNVSDAALQAQLELMNQLYAANTTNYPGPRANIQFTLARRTPDCRPFTGIVRVDARSVTNYLTTGLDGSSTQESQLRQLSGLFATRTAEKFVVVRVVQNISFAAGYAYFGGDIFIAASGLTSADTYNKLLSHEMGHVLFLQHTFNGSETSLPGSFTCPANANPAVDGDAVADTDPHKQNEPYNCFYQPTLAPISTINSCTGRPFGWIGNNIMAYGCYSNQFTQGQIDRMRAFLSTDNRSLGLSEYATPPVANEALTAATCAITTGNIANAGWTEGISRVRFNTIDKASNYVPFYYGYYQDYSCSDKTTVTAGSSYSLTINTSNSQKYRRVYLDANNDGTYNEATELIFSSNAGGNGMVTIPTNTVKNTYLRLRIVVDRGSVAPTACNLPGLPTYGVGEIEDYGLLVQSAPACQSATATLTGSQTVIAGQTATLTATLTGANPYSFTLSNGQSYSGITASPFTFTVAPSTSTAYSFLRVSNACGTGIASGNVVVTVTPCTSMYSVKAGNWTDPSTWSCNRVPTSSDTIEISHAVTIPANTTGTAQRINYANGGRIISGNGGKLQLGFP